MSAEGPTITGRARRRAYDAVVVGAGPNGLAAAIELVRSGRSVLLVERAPEVGGGLCTVELTRPGFLSDRCASVLPLGAGSPFFSRLPLAEHGLAWVHPAAPLAHPFDDGPPALLERSLGATGDSLGEDGEAYAGLVGPLVEDWAHLIEDALGPLRPPRHPLVMARFGLSALRSARSLAERRFAGPRARALFAGLAAHSMLPLEEPATAAIALVLAAAGHAVGWPLCRGGAGRLAAALADHLRSLGGEILTAAPVTTLAELPGSRQVLLDVTPRQLLAIAGERLSARNRRQLGAFRYGPGAFKLDWALDGPIPWRAPACARAGTVHLGGTLEEIAESERTVGSGGHPERPFVLFVQPSLSDETRAPGGRHVAWAYCHVPNGSTFDMTERIERQIERFAPGFRDRVLGRSVLSPARLEALNPNYVGGDINGGAQDLRQLFSRPTSLLSPYRTSAPGVYLCSSSTPPGGGVHGLCGYHAARAALREGPWAGPAPGRALW